MKKKLLAMFLAFMIMLGFVPVMAADVTRQAHIEVCPECSVEKLWQVTQLYTDSELVSERRAAKRDSEGELLRPCSNSLQMIVTTPPVCGEDDYKCELAECELCNPPTETIEPDETTVPDETAEPITLSDELRELISEQLLPDYVIEEYLGTYNGYVIFVTKLVSTTRHYEMMPYSEDIARHYFYNHEWVLPILVWKDGVFWGFGKWVSWEHPDFPNDTQVPNIYELGLLTQQDVARVHELYVQHRLERWGF
jgi:hypothetical protein